MMITSKKDTQIGTKASIRKAGDLLDCEKIDALPHPISLKMLGGDTHEVETICVETGFCRLISCGMIFNGDFGFCSSVIDANGNSHDSDIFYND
jgi:hypothetical protein